MSRRDDSAGGRYEPETLTFSGVGMAVTSACDECGKQGVTSGRRRLRVARGPLRGLVGNVCKACQERRVEVPA